MMVPVISAPWLDRKHGPQIHAIAMPHGSAIWLYEIEGGFITRQVHLSCPAARTLWAALDNDAGAFLRLGADEATAIRLALDGALRTLERAEAMARRAPPRDASDGAPAIPAEPAR